jgi:hypothetical protein
VAAAPMMIRKIVAAENNDPDQWKMVASDETVDRYGDVIRVAGWKLDNYNANPIVLFGHSSFSPIGTSEMKVVGKQLRSVIHLAKQGTSPEIDYYRSLIEQRILRASSVGFMPTEPVVPILDKDKRITGFEYVGQELLELSVVSVPANPAAVAMAKSMNLNPAVVLPRSMPDEGASAFIARRRNELALLRLQEGASAHHR